MPWLRLEGLHRFLAVEKKGYPHFILIALFILLLWYLADDMPLRIVVVSAFLAFYLFSMAWVVARHARSEIRALYRFLASIFLFYGIWLIFRTFTTLFAPDQTVISAATLANTLFFLGAMLLDIGVTVAFLMMNGSRLSLELGAAEERLRLTLEATNDGVWDWNIPTGQAVFSPRYYRMLGFEPYEFEQNYVAWRSLVHPEDIDLAEITINEHIRKNIGFAFEIRMKTKSGDWRWILSRGMVVERDREMKPVRMVGTHSDITERKRGEEKIQASLEEKETLLKEIHHRVKNNLQIISSLLKLQARTIADEKMEGIFGECQDRITAMAAVHSLLYKSQNFAEINFGDYVQETASQLFRSYRTNTAAISLIIEAENVMLPIDTAVPCGLLINELMTNALKYAFPGGGKGEIKVVMNRVDNGVRLLFEDNGIGFPKDVDFLNTETLGLKLIHLLVKQLDGSIEQRVENGTKYEITLKASAPGEIEHAEP